MNELEIRGLSKTYENGVKALDDVSLTIENGMYGLLGANGAGKSSLMRTIASLQEPSSGTIRLNGVDIIKNPDVVRKQLGFLPQEFGVYPKISAEKLLNHFGVLKGILNKKERGEQVKSLLQQTNLYQHRRKSVYTFSGGMRQRFGIAQALLGNPQLIIVDEPTAGLDPEERNRFLNLLSELSENIILILSTHLVEDVHDLCSRVAILSSGRIVEEGNPQELAGRLANKIWSKTVRKSEFSKYADSHQLISSRLVNGMKRVRVFAHEQPGTDFSKTSPELEDVYFMVNNNSNH